MQDQPRSIWSAPELLEALPGYSRCDDGTDLLAFRLAGTVPQRFVYVYLYGDAPDLINYDLEDRSAATVEWDYTVQRGSARTANELRVVVRCWLGTPNSA